LQGFPLKGAGLKFKYEHDFPCDKKALLEVVFENKITERLKPDMKTIVDAETLDWQRNGDIITRRVRYLPVPMIDSVGSKKVEPRWMEWIEESQADLLSGRVTFKNVPTTHGVAELLENSGVMEFVSLGSGKSRRVLTGELKVKVFLLGKIAEMIIADKARLILDDEAAALKRYLESGRQS
jgi:hypothetical protein